MIPETIHPVGTRSRNTVSGRFRRRPDSGRNAVAGPTWEKNPVPGLARPPHLVARVIGLRLPGPFTARGVEDLSD